MTAAIAIVYGGILLGLVVLAQLAAEQEDASATVDGLLVMIEVAVGVTAVGILGAGALRRSLGGALPLRAWWWGPVAGLGTFALSWAYVRALLSMVGIEPEPEADTTLLVIHTVVLAPLVEEWLCRGVLWDALRRVSSPKTTLVLTSFLFGMLHCVGGLPGLPHRFASGLVFGWLRQRTGSLLPGIAAHALHNLLAVSVL